MTSGQVVYPAAPVERDRFVLERRAAHPSPNPWISQNVVVEDERTADGQVAPTATVFLTGRECPWRCVMCDLWRYTMAGDTPPGAIPAQIAAARERLPLSVSQIKLYNAGSFFDPRAVPEADYGAIAAALDGFSHVIVESHPALVGPRVDRWLDALARSGDRSKAPRLEVAMGLETAHPVALERLHKRMSVEDFESAAAALTARGVRVRAFVLIAPPFIPDAEQERWLLHSMEVACNAGVSVVSLIPTRSGNGAIDALSDAGFFRQPSLDEIERSVDAALSGARGRSRVFVDLWDLERFSACPDCFNARRDRLHAMNLRQQILPRVECPNHAARNV